MYVIPSWDSERNVGIHNIRLANSKETNMTKATQQLHQLGQSIWLDNITRDLLSSGTLKRYIDELSVTGLTSNPTIFDHAIKNGTAYDDTIRQKARAGGSGEELFFGLALEDLTQAAELFKPVFERTDGDQWTPVSRHRFRKGEEIEAVAWDGDDLILAGEARGVFRITEADWRTSARRRGR